MRYRSLGSKHITLFALWRPTSRQSAFFKDASMTASIFTHAYIIVTRVSHFCSIGSVRA